VLVVCLLAVPFLVVHVQSGGVAVAATSSHVDSQVGLARPVVGVSHERFVRAVATMPWLHSYLMGVAGEQQGSEQDRVMQRRSAAGFVFTVSKTEERVLQVAPLSNDPLMTREAFVSFRATGQIGDDLAVPIQSGKQTAGLQLGCTLDVSGVSLGLAPQVSVSITAPPVFNVGVAPSINTTLTPGGITDVELASKQVADKRTSIMLQGMHVTVKGCVGSVVMRTWARYQVSTTTDDDVATIYSLPHDVVLFPEFFEAVR
jgi:hypothetical protein